METTKILKLSATYSPEDNKLRLYTSERLSPELYQRVKARGFSWAPKQKLFVAPMWTPSRADFLTDLCGDIGDEDTTLAERQEQRADRFDVYSDNRAKDAERAKDAVADLTKGISLGQPLVVGHHSQRRAEKVAEKIENGMRKAVRLWETSQYWIRRAEGALHHAKYKAAPGVRARRIKGLEADKRKQERHTAQAIRCLRAWESVETLTQARLLAGRTECGQLKCAKKEDETFWSWTAYNVLEPDET
jgi:hypothetical protein